jgi:hypothetical protein
MTVLPLRISPFTDEGMMGFLVRLAERNAFERVSWIYDLASINASVCISNLSLAKLSMISGVPLEMLESLRFFLLESGDVSFRGQTLRRVYVRGRSRRFCADCLCDTGYYKLQWDLASIRVCPDHRVRLIDKCPGCRKKISWYHPEILSCQCGYDLRSSPRKRVRSEDIKATEVLTCSLFGKVPEEQSPFRTFTYNALVELFLALHAGYYELRSPERRTIRQNDPNLHAILQRGYEIAEDWPNNFVKTLDRLRNGRVSKRGAFGLIHEFGRFHHAISGIEDPNAREIVHGSYRQYLRDNGEIGLTRRRSLILGGDDRLNATHYTTAQTADLLKISIGKVNRLVKAGLLLQPEESRGSGKPKLILASSVHACADHATRLVKQTDAFQVLGIHKQLLGKLVDRGLIRRYGAITEHSTPWLLDADDISKLMVSLTKTCSTPNRRNGLVDLYQAAKPVYGFGKGIADVIELILKGHLNVSGIDTSRRGLRQLLIDPEDMKQHAVPDGRSGCSYLTVVSFAKLIGVHPDSIAPLVQNGFISKYKRNPSMRAEYRISEEAVPEFLTKYISAPSLAKELGVPWQTLTYLLPRNGIEAVASSRRGNSRTFIYERAGAINDLIARGYQMSKKATQSRSKN